MMILPVVFSETKSYHFFSLSKRKVSSDRPPDLGTEAPKTNSPHFWKTFLSMSTFGLIPLNLSSLIRKHISRNLDFLWFRPLGNVANGIIKIKWNIKTPFHWLKCPKENYSRANYQNDENESLKQVKYLAQSKIYGSLVFVLLVFNKLTLCFRMHEAVSTIRIRDSSVDSG